MKRPAYQWHVPDARSDEVYMLMTYEQRGVYRELLDQQWVEGSLPANPQHLAGLLRMPVARFEKLWPLISGKFRARDDGRLINDRLESYRCELDEFVKIRAKNGSKGAEARWRRHRRSHGKANATAMANDSSVSVSVSVPSVKEQHSGASAKPPSPAREFLSWFQDEYRSRRDGAAYFVAWGRHMPIVTRLLNLHSPERLRKHATILLTSNDDWITSTDRGIEVLAGKINWLEERLAAWETKRKAREAV